VKPEVIFVGLREGLIEYRCATCGMNIYLKPYVCVQHTEKECDEAQSDGLATLRPPRSVP
jgi:hypothetical protein